VKEPIGHPNWIYELKHDGFRGILYVDRDQAWLVTAAGRCLRILSVDFRYATRLDDWAFARRFAAFVFPRTCL
jgi:hypothetical protein